MYIKNRDNIILRIVQRSRAGNIACQSRYAMCNGV